MWMQMFPLSWSQFVARSQACLCIDLEDVVCFPALFCNRCAAPSVQMMRLMFFSWRLPAVWERIGRALAFWSPLRFLSTQEAFVDFAETGPTGLYWLIVCTPERCTIRADLIHSTDSTWTWLNMPEASVAATICTFIARSKECQSKVQTCLGRWLPPKSAPCSDPIRRSGLVRRSWWVSWLRCCCSCLGWKLQGGRGVHDSPQNPQFFSSGEEGCFPSTGDQVIVAAQKFCWPVILGPAGLFGPLSSTNPDGLLTHTPTSSHLWSPGVGDSPV